MIKAATSDQTTARIKKSELKIGLNTSNKAAPFAAVTMVE